MTRRALALLLIGGPLALASVRAARGADAPAAPALTGRPEEAGAIIAVTGKYKELVGQELFLVDDSRPFLLSREELLGKVLDLRSHRDNVRIVGKTSRGERRGAVEVEELELAPSDAQILGEKHREIESAPPAERVEPLLELLGEISATHSRYGEPDVLEVGRRVAREVASLPATEGAEKKFEEHLRRVQKVGRILARPELTLELLVDLDRRFPDRPELVEAFRGLNCRRHSGRWVTYEEFKRLEGFVFHEGKWLKPHEKHLLDTLRAFGQINRTNLILRRRTEREYKLLSDQGLVEVGMKPEEVYAALGPPERVERRVHDRKEFDQWIYGRSYYYFYAGLLVRTPESPAG